MDTNRTRTVYFPYFLTVFLAITAALLTKINNKQPEPYMDEIFHIPQAQSYCQSNYSHWNNKITTLPGLYILSQIILKVASLMLGTRRSDLCFVLNLRLTNFALICACLYVIRCLVLLLNSRRRLEGLKNQEDRIKKVHITNAEVKPSLVEDELKCETTAFVCCTFPLLYFFTFFYYTDVGSTFFVLLSYYLSLREYHYGSALIGTIAVVFRQTNIVWIVFIAANCCLQYLIKQNTFLDRERSGNVLKDIYLAFGACLSNPLFIIRLILPYGLVLLCFLVFICINKGIVVGDRSSHEASLNLPQILYFGAFTLFFSCHLLLRLLNVRILQHAKDSCKSPQKLAINVIIILLMFAVVFKFTIVHKYTLADNRHYTFYIWRKIINRFAYSRYLLIPVYFVSWSIIWNQLKQCNHTISVLLLIICTSIALVPQKLLELRYFIIPYILIKLSLPISSYTELMVEFATYFIVNTLTIFLFLNKPFYWSHDMTNVQRFMW